MDKAEQIMTALAASCEGIFGADRVEMDRPYDVSEADDVPLVVVRTGEEETAPADNAPPRMWAHRWEMRPQIEVYFVQHDPSAMRAEMSRIWGDFRSAFGASSVLPLLSPGTAPEIKRTIMTDAGSPHVGRLLVELALTFER